MTIQRILFSVFILGLFLRLFELGVVPAGLHRDEVYLGYNAYSILKTGKDISGDLLPVHIESFLNSPAGYSYFSIPFIALFGLSVFSVRVASALFGSATVILVYFLVKKLFGEYKYSRQLGLLSSFSLAISPWHINLSRVATENVLVVFFITLGTILLISWIKTNDSGKAVAGFLLYGLSLLTYQAPRAFLPLFIPLIFIIFRKKLELKRLSLPFALFLLTILLPVMLIILSPNLSQRIRMLSIFQHPQTKLVLEEQYREDGESPLLITRTFHNKPVNYSITFLDIYFKHFSFDFLFTDAGYPERYRVAQMGLLYLFELPLLFIGLLYLFKISKNSALLLLGWIFLAPLGSGLTFDDVPNLQRTLIAFPAVSIASAAGLIFLWQYLGKFRFVKLARITVVLIIIYGFTYYLHQYYVHQVNHRPWFRQEGYEELVRVVNKLSPKYKKVVVTDIETEPAIFFLFYNKTNPLLVQKKIKDQQIKSEYGLITQGKIEFVDNDCPLREEPTISESGKMEQKLIGEKNVLYVNGPRCKVENKNVRTVSAVKRSDSTSVFELMEVY